MDDSHRSLPCSKDCKEHETLNPKPAGGVPISTLVAPHDRRRAKQLGLDTNKSLQSLGIEAWSDLFIKYGLKPFYPQPANRLSRGRKRP